MLRVPYSRFPSRRGKKKRDTQAFAGFNQLDPALPNSDFAFDKTQYKT